MDIRGPADQRDANNHLSQLQREIVRIEPGGESPSAPGPQFSSHTAAPEIAQYLRELKALPEVREELVQETISKLREGQYSTRQSAEQTAEAVLRMLNEE